MEFDEISRAIGRLEQSIENIRETQESQWKKLDKIDNYIVSHKIWIAGIAGSASLISSMAFYYLRKKIFGD